MKQQQTLQPKLRFPEFEGNWKNKALNDISEIKSGGTPSRTNPKFWNGDIPWITTSLVDYNDIINSEEYITVEAVENSSAKIFPINTILMAMYGQGNTRGRVSKLKIEATTNQACAAIIVNQDQNYNFIYQILVKSYDDLRNLSNEGGQKNLSLGIIKDFNIKLPSLPEQQKIADYLSTIDNKINLLEEKKAQLALYKKAMIQKLFAQEIRFKDDNGNDYPEWESVQLKDILLEHKEKNKNNKYSEVLSVAKHKGVINQIEHLGRSYSAEKIDHYKVINPFDIVYTKSPTSGFPFGIIKQNKLNRSGVLSPLYAVFRPKTKYLGMILHDLFSSEIETYNYLVPLVQKGAKNTMNINNDEFLKGKKYFLPTSELEQQKIADFLSAIDESITKVEEQIKETQNFKKAMLQQLFV